MTVPRGSRSGAIGRGARAAGRGRASRRSRNRAERLRRPASVLCAGDRELVDRDVAAAPGPLARALRRRRRPQRGRGAARARRSPAEPLPTRRRGELWVHELIGADGARPRRARRSGGSSRSRRTRRTTCSCSTDGVLVPMVFVVEHDARRGRRRPARRPARPVDGATVRIDVFTIFPEYLERPLGVVAARPRARARAARRARCTTRATYTTDRHRSVDDAPFGGGAGMVMMPRAAVRRGRGGRAAAAAAPAVGERAALRPGARRASSPRRPGFSLMCGATKASTSGSPITSATASSRSATSCSRAARPRRSS